jgi:hypothetical protein
MTLCRGSMLAGFRTAPSQQRLPRSSILGLRTGPDQANLRVTMLLTRISTIGTSTSSLPAGAAATGSTLLNNILIHGLSKPACKRALDRRSPFGRMVQNQCESCGSRPHPLAGRHSYSHTATPSSSLAAAKPTDDPVRSMCAVRTST